MENEDEFFQDFGSAPLTDEQLEALLEQARTVGDRTLRLLVKQHQTLRQVASMLLERIETDREGEQLASDQVIKLARFVIRNEGGIAP